jgi:small membrane protein
MIAQVVLTVLLLGVIAYACSEYSRAPAIGITSLLTAIAGLYFVWLPTHASWLAHIVGIHRGVDLFLYVWVIISLILFLNLHLKLRSQTELITALAREIAITNAGSENHPPGKDFFRQVQAKARSARLTSSIKT